MATHLRIIGAVQGVGYRAAFCATAQALNLSGWVRNRHDGSVEAMLTGEATALAEMIAWSRHGPRGARVQEVIANEVDDDTMKVGRVEVLPTA